MISLTTFIYCFFIGRGAKVSVSRNAHFEQFIVANGREFTSGTQEYDMRNDLFQASLAAVETQNSKPNQLWKATINHLSDRTPTEMQALNVWRGGVTRPGFRSPAALVDVTSFLQQRNATTGVTDLPEGKDYAHLWTAQKKQIHSQTCGNCWAAATASLLEAHAEIHMKEQRHFSFQELTQCTENPFNCGGSGGCAGATSELALHQVMVNGIGKQEGDAKKCAGTKHIVDKQEQGRHEMGSGVRLASPEAVGRKIGMVGWERLPENKYEPFLRALVERGPVAVALAPEWTNYGSGIYDGCSKDATISHAVLAMGFGIDKKLDNTKYWLIQNSWGSSFGENGLIRLKRSDNEEEYCGKDTQPTLGTACENGPSEVKVCGTCGILYDVTVPYFEGPGKP